MLTGWFQKPFSKTLEDYCPIRAVDGSGVICDRDGAKGAVYRLSGVDAAFFEERDWQSLHQSWRALLRLEPDEELQIVFSKRGDFEDHIEKRFQELERIKNWYTRRLFLESLSDLFETVGKDEPVLFTTQITLAYRWLCREKPSHGHSDEEIERRLGMLEGRLHAMGLGARRLLKAELSSEMAAAASGRTYVREKGILDSWPEVLISARQIKVGHDKFRALALSKLPESYSEMGMMRVLTSLRFPIDIAVRFRGQNPAPIKRKLERKKNILFSMATHKNTGDPQLSGRIHEIDALLRRLSDQNDCVLQMNVTLAIRARDENELYLRRMLTEILSTQSRLGFLEFEECSISSFDRFLETIPWLSGKSHQGHTVLASNGVHFLPLFESDLGSSRTVTTFRTREGHLYSINPMGRELANFNWLVSGTSGAGKSFFVNSVISQSMSLNPHLFIVDVGGSYNKLVRYLGGEVIGLDARSGFRMGPFFISKSGDEFEERRRREHILLIFLEMLRDEGSLPSVEERALLSDSLTVLFDAEKLPSHPISFLRDHLASREGSQARRLAILLNRWCYPSFFGDFLDFPDSVARSGNEMVAFDLKGISEFDDLSRVVQLIICSSVWSRIRLATDRFTYVVLDEVAFTLLKFQPQFVDELVSTLRKYNAGAILIVQDLEKITSNPAGASILQNTQIKAILQQRGDPKNYAGPLALREADIAAIGSLNRKRGSFSEIFLMIDDRRAVVRYVPNLLEYYLATSVPQENRALEERLQNYNGSFSERLIQLIEEESA